MLQNAPALVLRKGSSVVASWHIKEVGHDALYLDDELWERSRIGA